MDVAVKRGDFVPLPKNMLVPTGVRIPDHIKAQLTASSTSEAENRNRHQLMAQSGKPTLALLASE